MKQYVTEHEFKSCFLKSDTYKNNFSNEGLTALFQYLEQYEESTGGEIVFDMVALCCEYSEYESAWEAAEAYDGAVEDNKDFDDEDRDNAAIAWLEERTQVIPVGDTGRVIIQGF